MDIVKLVDNYLGESTWKVKENSNSNYSFAGLQGYISSEVLKEYALNTMYEGEIAKAHDDGFIHIHDLSHPMVPYCAGYGMKMIVEEGFNAGSNFIYSDPPKHLDSLFGQINNFIFTMSGEWAGAQALNSVDTYSAAFIKKDNLGYDEVYRAVRQLIYNLNVKTRLAMQSPFTNFSFDLTVPSDLKDEEVVIGGEPQGFKFSDVQEEMNLFNEVFIDCMMEGDAMNKIFTFPIVTYGITPEFEWDSPLAEKMFRFADECNSPYFSNFINSDQDPSDIRSMCPLHPDTLVKVMIQGEILDKKIEDLRDIEFKTYFNGEWRDSRVIEATPQNTIKITDEKSTIELGEHHQHSIIRDKESKVVSAYEIVEGDYMVYNEDGIFNFYKVIDIEYIDKSSDDLLCIEVIEDA